MSIIYIYIVYYHTLSCMPNIYVHNSQCFSNSNQETGPPSARSRLQNAPGPSTPDVAELIHGCHMVNKHSY